MFFTQTQPSGLDLTEQQQGLLNYFKQANTNTTYISWARCNLNNDDLDFLIKQCMANNTHITGYDFTRNNLLFFPNSGLDTLTNLLQLIHIESLDLSQNYLSKEAVLLLFQTPHIKRLDLQLCSIELSTLEEILRLDLNHLTRVDLSKNGLPSDLLQNLNARIASPTKTNSPG